MREDYIDGRIYCNGEGLYSTGLGLQVTLLSPGIPRELQSVSLMFEQTRVSPYDYNIKKRIHRLTNKHKGGFLPIANPIFIYSHHGKLLGRFV